MTNLVLFRAQPYGIAMNRLLTALFLTALTPLFFSQQVFAERPAADSQHESSAVKMMMQQESQQTGDVVSLPAKEIQPGETLSVKLLDFPRRGMSMDNVRSEYGQPSSISDSVGQPPIARWTYSDRIVFFEYSTVIHVVAR